MKQFLSLMFATLLCGTICAETPKKIVLDKPNLNSGKSLMMSLSERYSEREFKSDNLSHADLSNLLWAANGINRENGKRTAPSALNKQEIYVYAFMQSGVYKYDEKSHALVLVAEGDNRTLLNGGQNFADKGALGLLLVGDAAKFEGQLEEKRQLLIAVDAGIVCQNINLFCASAELANVPRLSMNVEGIKNLLKLSEDEVPLMNNIIGYRK